MKKIILSKKQIIYCILLILVILVTVFAVATCGDDEETASDSSVASSQSSEQAAAGSQDQSVVPPDVVASENAASQDPATFVANKDAEKAVNTILGYIKKGKFDKAQKLILPKLRFEDEPDLGFDDITMKKVAKILAKLDYKVINSNTTSDTTAIVNVKIKSANFKKVFTEYMKNVKEAQSKGYKNEKEYQKLIDQAFEKSLKDNGTKLIEKKVAIQLVKKKGKWQIQDTIEFSEAVLGGIPAASYVFIDIP